MSTDLLVPVRAFEHLGEKFTPANSVPADHPMVALRPDLFKSPPNTKE